MDEEQLAEALAESSQLGMKLLQLAAEDNATEATSVAYDAYQETPEQLILAMTLWHRWARESKGTSSVRQVVENLTLNIHNAPVEEPMTRMIICDILYGLEDGNDEKVAKAWDRALVAGWDTVVEVVSLMLGFAGYFTA